MTRSPTRIGISNGAFMTNRLACDRADPFAAIAPVSGTLGVNVGCAPSMIDRWREIDGCHGVPTEDVLPSVGDGIEVHRFSSTACSAGSAAVFMQVDNGGHTWPGGTQYLPTAIIGPTSHAFDASETSWQFVASHAR
jgi:polyhydroxybutyrate depolymerase